MDGSTKESSKRNVNRVNPTDENYESVIFIWFNPQDQSSVNIVGPLRAINHNVQTFNESSSCFEMIRSSNEKIFFISSVNNNQLISTVHDFPAVEAIFILDPNEDMVRGDFPKLFGVFPQQEELLRLVKEVFDAFEQVQLEDFAFEQEKIFLWSQLWKEELISRKVASNKTPFIEICRQYYRDNTRIIGSIEELEKSYRLPEVINWCCRSPFPSRFLLHALRSHNKSQLNACRFLLSDATRFFHQNLKPKSSDQVYRGMKLSNELLDQFESHIGELVCTSGFFLCTKLRTNALTLASLPTYRPDLQSVLFKIDCDASSLFTEISNKQTSSLIVFDPCMAFRIVYVNRAEMSVIKLKTAGDAGKKFAADYMNNHKNTTIPAILDELLRPPTPPPKPPTPPPPRVPTPPPRVPTPPPPPREPTPPQEEPVEAADIMPSFVSEEETKAQEYARKGNVDLALSTYQNIRPMTARIFNKMGELCAVKKGDYDYALYCHHQALKMQEQSGEDISSTLIHIGNAHRGRDEFHLALDNYNRALGLRRKNPQTSPATLAANYLSIGKAHWGRREYPQAITNTEEALVIQEGLVPPDEINVGVTMSVLGNIYRNAGDSARALDLCTRALDIFRHKLPPYSPTIANTFYQLGKTQSSLGALADAQQSFEQSSKIYRKTLPPGHPDRMSVDKELRRVTQLLEQN